MIDDFISNHLIPFAVRLGLALLILVVGIAIVRLLLRWLRKLLERSGADPVLIHFASSVANALLLVLVAILALDQLGVETSYLFAVLTGLLVALGLALQDSLHVEVILPNAAVASATIRNFSARPTRRIDMLVRISYGDDLRRARQILLDVMKADDRVLQDPGPQVTVAELAETGVHLNVRPWVSNADYSAAKGDLTEAIKLAFDEKGLTIPYPQMDVHLEPGGGTAPS
jgi:small conductance mechanosensitive channel